MLHKSNCLEHLVRLRHRSLCAPNKLLLTWANSRNVNGNLFSFLLANTDIAIYVDKLELVP